MIRDYQAIQRTWFEKGKQRVIKTTGKHRGVKLLATVHYCTGQVVWQEDVTLKFCGLRPEKRFVFSGVKGSAERQRTIWLERVYRQVRAKIRHEIRTEA